MALSFQLVLYGLPLNICFIEALSEISLISSFDRHDNFGLVKLIFRFGSLSCTLVARSYFKNLSQYALGARVRFSSVISVSVDNLSFLSCNFNSME